MQKAVIQAISAGQFDIAKLQHRREDSKENPQEDKPVTKTLSECFEEYEKKRLALACREGTRDRYETSFKYILPELGSLPLNEITRDRIEDFVAHLVGKRYQKRIRVKTYPDPKKKRNPIIEWKTVEVPFSRTTIRIILSQLCAVLNYAVEKNIVEKNPALKHTKLYTTVKNAREKIQPLSAEEVETFLAAVLNRSWSREYYPVFLCALHTGMRASEIVGLQWGDVDFRGKFFLLWRQFTRGASNRQRRANRAGSICPTL